MLQTQPRLVLPEEEELLVLRGLLVLLVLLVRKVQVVPLALLEVVGHLEPLVRVVLPYQQWVVQEELED
jgi:hypothetical protein